MELFNHSQLKGEKLQFKDGVVGFSLCQAPTGVGYENIRPSIISEIEDSPQTRPTSISMQFKRPRKNGIDKNGTMVHRCFSSSNACWHLSFQMTVAFFLPEFSLGISSCRGQATCANLGMNW